MRVFNVLCLLTVCLCAHVLRAQDSLRIQTPTSDLATIDSFARPQQVIFTMIKGQIKAFNNKVPAQAKLSVIDAQSYIEQPYVYKPDSVDGKFFMLLSPQRNYRVLVELEGYKPYQFDLYVPARTYHIDIQKDIYFETINLLGNSIGQQTYEQNGTQRIVKLFDESNALEKVKYDFMVEFIDYLVSYENQDNMAMASAAMETETNENQNVSQEETSDSYYDPLVSLIDSAIQVGNIKLIEELLTKAENTPRQTIFFFEKEQNEEPILASGPNAKGQQDVKCLAKHVLYFEPKQTKLNRTQKNQINEILDFLSKQEGTSIEVSAMVNPQDSLDMNVQINQAQNRAWRMSKYLKKNAIESERISKISFGADCTITSPETESDMANMHQVHIYITKRFGYDIHE